MKLKSEIKQLNFRNKLDCRSFTLYLQLHKRYPEFLFYGQQIINIRIKIEDQIEKPNL